MTQLLYMRVISLSDLVVWSCQGFLDPLYNNKLFCNGNSYEFKMGLMIDIKGVDSNKLQK